MGKDMRLEKCWFCSNTIYPGHGMIFVRNDSKIFRFCRPKCHNFFRMKRNPRNALWTKMFRKRVGKDLIKDVNVDMKRNRPQKCNRCVMKKTMEAMQKVEAIQRARQDRIYEIRAWKARIQHRILHKKYFDYQSFVPKLCKAS